MISGPSGLEVGGADLTWKTGRHVSATSSSVCDLVMCAGVGGAVGGADGGRGSPQRSWAQQDEAGLGCRWVVAGCRNP